MALLSNFRIVCSSIAMITAVVTLTQSTNTQAATSLSQCVGSSRQLVINCCQQAINGHRPAWMIESHSSCKQSVICGGKAGAKKCRVVQFDNQSRKGKDNDNSGKTRSDARLKTDIHRVGTTVLNLPLYSFQYRGQTATYIGVMAQDVLKVEPSAVSVGRNGYYMVDYDKLGIKMLRVQ